MQGGVCKDPQLAPEPEVLLVVGHELQVVALVVVHVKRVDDVESVKVDSIFTNRACERILQQPYLVVVDVNVGENVFYNRIQYIAGLYEVVYSGCVLP